MQAFPIGLAAAFSLAALLAACSPRDDPRIARLEARVARLEASGAVVVPLPPPPQFKLVVTWLEPEQPPTTNETLFSDSVHCLAARQAILDQESAIQRQREGEAQQEQLQARSMGWQETLSRGETERVAAACLAL